MKTWGQRAKRRRHGQGDSRLVRYCDDFVLMVSGERRHTEALREEVSAVLAPLGLRLAPEKTAVLHIDEGFVFLGHHIRRQRKRGTSKYCVYTKPSKKAIQSIKDKVKVRTYRPTRHMDLDELILSLNRALAGWASYFRHGASKATFNPVDYFAWGRLMRWIRAKYGGKSELSIKELRRRFCDQGWRFAWNGRVHRRIRVAVTRYSCRGSAVPTPWIPKPAAADQRATHAERRCAETCTLGAAGGPGKPSVSNHGRAPRSDPTVRPAVRGRDIRSWPSPIFVGVAAMAALALECLINRRYRRLIDLAVATAGMLIVSLAIHEIARRPENKPNLTAFWDAFYVPTRSASGAASFIHAELHELAPYMGFRSLIADALLVLAGIAALVWLRRLALAALLPVLPVIDPRPFVWTKTADKIPDTLASYDVVRS